MAWLALGSFRVGRFIDRSRNPLRVRELEIGMFACVLALRPRCAAETAESALALEPQGAWRAGHSHATRARRRTPPLTAATQRGSRM